MIEMFKGVANSPETTITNDINNTDTIIYVLDETRIPEDLPNLMVLGTGVSAETVKVVSIEGNAITVERGFQGIPRAWNAGTIIARNFTEYDYNALVENVKTLKGNTDTNADDILSLMNYVGNLENLDTVEKSNIVLALNEIYQDLIAHKADYASFKNNIEGIRYVDEKMELKINGEWVEFKNKDGYPVGNISNLSANIGNGEVALSWQDPPDVTIEDSEGNIITIARWAGTKLVRKTGSYPVHENDGTLIVDNTVYNQYQSNGFIDDGLSNGTTYYYMLFPYTEEDIATIDSANRISATPQAYDDLTGSPGAKNLISGTMEEGFFGEVSSSELITGDDLASQVGISQGTSQHSTAGWLKFAYKGEMQFVAKKPIRHSISWDTINTAKCVYGDSGDKTVTIDGLTYKVTLMRALEPTNDPKTTASASSGEVNHGSEWNRLMCQIHEQALNKSWDYPNNVENDIGILDHNLGNGSQGMYNDTDLVVKSGDGRSSWCQEMSTSTSSRLYRGTNGVSNSSDYASSISNANCGWRPRLELVP